MQITPFLFLNSNRTWWRSFEGLHFDHVSTFWDNCSTFCWAFGCFSILSLEQMNSHLSIVSYRLQNLFTSLSIHTRSTFRYRKNRVSTAVASKTILSYSLNLSSTSNMIQIPSRSSPFLFFKTSFCRISTYFRFENVNLDSKSCFRDRMDLLSCLSVGGCRLSVWMFCDMRVMYTLDWWIVCSY